MIYVKVHIQGWNSKCPVSLCYTVNLSITGMHLIQSLDKNMQFGRYEVLKAAMKKIPYF
jgi:hypothetical protein